MLSKLRWVASLIREVYGSWRGPLAAAIGVVLVVGAAVGVADPSRRLVLASAVFLAWVIGCVFVAVEVARQDRLRRQTAQRLAATAPVAKPGAHTPTTERLDVPPPVRMGTGQPPTVTVVLIAHNEASHVADAIRSVRAQSFTDLECIVVDDASTDDTLNIAHDATEGDIRFRFLHLEHNVGPSAARNAGLAEAQGEFVTFLDADDFLYPDAIASRVEVIASDEDLGWTAGAYCYWHPVAEDAVPTAATEHRDVRGRVTWFDALTDAPFIASAPLLRTSVVRGIGGWNSQLRSAEDSDIWSRILRHGYIIEAAHYTGIAYRQKRQSNYRRTAVAHSLNTLGLQDFNYRPLRPDEVTPGAPYVYVEPAPTYERRLATVRRLITGLAGAISVGEPSVIDELANHLREVAEPYVPRVLDIAALVQNASIRLERHDEDGLVARAAMLQRRVWAVLGPIVGIDPALRRPSSSVDAPLDLPPSTDATARKIVDPVTVPAAPQLLSEDRVRVMLLPESAYHVDELNPLADLLRARGVEPVMTVSTRRLPYVRAELRKYPGPVYTFEHTDPPVEFALSRCNAIVTMNDWGECRPLVEAANDAGLPTFGKVEGVQDFTDADVHWTRNAYQTVAHVLCQGQNDSEATSGSRHIVGSSRLERIWLAPPRKYQGDLAVVNLNFTYGVLDDARELWLQTVVQACREAAMPYVISLHPAERSRLTHLNVADAPVRHLLTSASVLVSRFSTVPFEAMARGVPFIYHNPHGEKVPTFQNPNGAFPVTTDAASLAEALQASRDHVHDYREVCRDFFLRQVDVDPQRSSEHRTIDVLADILPPL